MTSQREAWLIQDNPNPHISHFRDQQLTIISLLRLLLQFLLKIAQFIGREQTQEALLELLEC